MVDQATRVSSMGGPSTSDGTDPLRIGPIQGVTQGASSVLGDALDLAELQVKLIKADAASCAASAKAAIAGTLISLALMLASLPVLAFGLAELLHWSLEWPLWVCQLLVGVLFAGLGAGLGFWCVQRLRHSLSAFAVSQHEAAANLRWLRQALSRTFPTN